MACDAVTDYVVRESGRYMEDILRRGMFAMSPWLAIVRRGVWPKGRGETINILTYERSAPDEANPTWTSVAVNDGAEGGVCLPAAEVIPVGSTTRNFTLYRRVLEGPDFCAVEFQSPFELTAQLNAISDILGNYIRITWEMRDRNQYFTYCQTKVIVDGCPPTEDTDMLATWDAVATAQAATCPTSILTQGILDRYRIKLLRDGAIHGALGMRNGAPILTLICSAETSDNIIRLNADIRQDLRDGAPSKLLAPFGINQDYRGFFHLLDPFPRRWECSGGTYTEVKPFDMAAATKGQKADVNSAWETATYEESFIFDPTVFTQLVPNAVTNPAPKFKFDPVSYVGNIQTMNIPDRKCNPDGTILYHRASLMAASMPMHPERGVAFIHLRCDPACNLVTACTT